MKGSVQLNRVIFFIFFLNKTAIIHGSLIFRFLDFISNIIIKIHYLNDLDTTKNTSKYKKIN
jgi:hypothetical protein